ncbi:MAG: PilW family protein [Proteobacteria bacterium]|nr:PilW family protein [Pseudomonadota bacterium]MBU1686772.1 PilW family protein [Pseudomonadota bacterium]
MLNTTNDLELAYGTLNQASVYRLNIATYFIRDKDLYYNGTNNKIANNIEDLQFQFIFDTDADNDLTDEAWQNSFTVGGTTYPAEAARAIRVFLLARSEPIYRYLNKTTYDYPNSPYYSVVNTFGSANGGGGSPASQAPMADKGEYRYRMLASSTIYLRNAGIE